MQNLIPLLRERPGSEGCRQAVSRCIRRETGAQRPRIPDREAGRTSGRPLCEALESRFPAAAGRRRRPPKGRLMRIKA
jgi:hypothetical protein